MSCAIITVDEVKSLYATTISDSMIQRYINQVYSAKDCLDELGVSTENQELLMLNAVAHQLFMQDGGQVKSESSMTGASVTYNTYAKSGLGASPYGVLIQGMTGSECITSAMGQAAVYPFRSLRA